MKDLFAKIIIVLAAFSIPVAINAKSVSTSLATPAQYKKQLTTTGLLFTPNMGQVADTKGILQPDVLYTATNGGMRLFLCSNAISYQFTHTSPSGKKGELHDVAISNYRFSLELVGSNPHPIIRRELQSSLTKNFYLPHCKDGIIGVPSFGRLVYENVYPGIDWVIYNNDNHLEYDFNVRAGADLSSIRMRLKDGGAIPLAADGSLVIKTPLGEVHQHAPKSFVNSKEVNSHFCQYADGTIGFIVPGHKPNEAIVIDPTVSWGTYYGGASAEQVNAVAVSGNNVFLVGTTGSVSGISDSINGTTHSYQKTLGGSTAGVTDEMVVKLDSTGAVQWATYYGASGADLGVGVAVDASNNVYVAGALAGGTGYSTIGTYQGAIDALLIKFSSTGTRLWSVDFGGTSGDYATGCAVDNTNGFVYLTGQTKSKTGIATNGAYKTDTTGITANYDAFLAQFNTSGTLQWSTYYGGAASEYNANTAIDASGNVYLAANTTSTSGIASSTSVWQDTLNGVTDIFLAKFNSSGTLQWGTYYGGTSNTSFPNNSSTNGRAGIAITGNTIYLAGRVNTNGIGTTGTYQSTYSGAFDAFLASFNTSGSRNWCTYYGNGSGSVTYGFDCAVDGQGGVYMAGYTSSTASVLTTASGFQTSNAGAYDGFVAKFDSTGARQWGSYYGGSDTDYVYACAADQSGYLYLAGTAKSTSGIATSGAAQASNGGGYDGFVTRIADPVIAIGTVNTTVCEGANLSIPYTVTGNFPASNVFTAQLSSAAGSFASPVNIGTITGNTSSSITAVIPIGTLAGNGYRVRIFSSSVADTSVKDVNNITINALPVVGALTGSTSVCVGSMVTLSDTTASGAWSTSNTSKATVAAGVVSGVSAGTAAILYTVTANGCATTVTDTITVNAVPAVNGITGTGTLCAGATTTLSNTTTGGIWSSNNTANATVAGGIVTGVAAGRAAILYTVTNVNNCSTVVTDTVTINALPVVASITGTATLCAGATTTLSNTTTSGVWSSNNTANATVAGDIVTGVAPGRAAILYTVTNANNCTTIVTDTVTVNALPVVASITGTATLCAGATTTLSNTTTGGVWSSNSSAVATVVAGLVTGVSSGRAAVLYTLTNSNNCTTIVTDTVTVNALPVVASITGTATLCAGATTTLSNTTTGGVWSSSNVAKATVAGGVVTGVSAGRAGILYTVTNSNNCTTVVVDSVTVNALPLVAATTGTATLCAGATTTLSNTTTGGIWSSGSTANATVAGGVVTGISAGKAAILYTVTNTNNCSTVVTDTVTVNALPVVAAISGTATLCAGATTTLNNTTTGGVWSSNNTGKATVANGTVTGVSAGVAAILYTVTNTNNCTTVVTDTVTVKALPIVGPITGTATLCTGLTTTLSDTTLNGIWSSNNTGVATVNSSGVVTGIIAGNPVISYSVTNNGCTATATKNVTVNAPAIAAINGPASVCAGATITLSDTTIGGGTWSSTGSATVNASGVVTGVAAGTAIITFSVLNSCGTYLVKDTITVKALPVVAPITGPASVCTGTSISLVDTTANGVWSSNVVNANVAGGVVSGVSAGSAVISYSVTAINSCTTIVTDTITINTLPVVAAITGASNVCAGSTITLTNVTPGGAWSTGDASKATVTAGVVTGIAAGAPVISYAVTNTCGTTTITDTITVNPISVVSVTITATPGTSISSGQSDTLSAMVTGAVSPAYSWYINGVLVPGATSSSFVSNTFANNDTVICKVSSNGPCSQPGFGTIVINVGVSVPSINLGITGINLFPNPNEGNFMVTGEEVGNNSLTLEVTDILGQVIYKKEVLMQNGHIREQLSLSNSLANGVYNLNIYSGNDKKTIHFVLGR